VTLYVPASKNRSITIDYLRSFIKRELAETENIKDKANRKIVIGNLQWILNDVVKLGKIPDNGVVFFYGVGKYEDETLEIRDMIVPHLPISNSKYYCGKEFLVEALEEMIVPSAQIVVILLEGGKLAWGILKGSHLEVKHVKNYHVPGKTRKGGMSAKRYGKLRQEKLVKFYKEVAIHLNKELLNNIDDIEMIIFGGNMIRVKEFIKTKYLDYRLRNKIHETTMSIGLINENGLEQSKKEIAKILTDHILAKEKNVWDKFIALLMKGNPKAIYGRKQVYEAILEGRVETMLWFEGYSFEAPLELMAEGFDMVFFPEDTEWGQQLKAFGGFAAILRY
jgi:peptide chain release factor subunit 1